MTIFPLASSWSELPTVISESFAYVETLNHPYQNSRPFMCSSKIQFDSTTRYRIDFDSLSRTELGYDFVEIYVDIQKVYSNSGNNWSTVYIDSDDGLNVCFSSDETDSFWGFRMKISDDTDDDLPTDFISKSMDNFSYVSARFEGNRAVNGGAVHLDYSNTNVLILPGSFFLRNVASPSHERETTMSSSGHVYAGAGGALLLSLKNEAVYVFSTVFERNEALSGGAVAVMYENTMVHFTDTLFDENIATKDGGALFIGTNNGDGVIYSEEMSVRLYSSECRKNSAILDGGCISLHQLNRLELYDTLLVNNSCEGSGGGIFISNGYLQVSNCKFIGNRAYFLGGALSAFSSEVHSNNPWFKSKNVVEVFRDNVAQIGGAIDLRDSSFILMKGFFCFENNTALFGGAMSVVQSKLIIEPSIHSFLSQPFPGFYFHRSLFRMDSIIDSQGMKSSEIFFLISAPVNPNFTPDLPNLNHNFTPDLSQLNPKFYPEPDTT
jgi:hypothetical protein